MNYDRAILEALASAEQPLGHRDLLALLDPENKDYFAFNYVGLALTRLYRAGFVTRERVRRDATQRRWYVYRLKEAT